MIYPQEGPVGPKVAEVGDKPVGPRTPSIGPSPLCLGVCSAPSGQETCPSLGGNGSVRGAQGQLLARPGLGTRFQLF